MTVLRDGVGQSAVALTPPRTSSRVASEASHGVPELEVRKASQLTGYLLKGKIRPDYASRMLHCFDPLANDDLSNLLRSLGCEPVPPDSCNLVSDDVRYGKQLESFRKQGVDDVVYVQSFGCMKANVQVRGQMHRLKAGCASGRARMLCECEQCARTGCARSLPYASASGPAAGPSLVGREPRPPLKPSEKALGMTSVPFDFFTPSESRCIDRSSKAISSLR